MAGELMDFEAQEERLRKQTFTEDRVSNIREILNQMAEDFKKMNPQERAQALADLNRNNNRTADSGLGLPNLSIVENSQGQITAGLTQPENPGTFVGLGRRPEVTVMSDPVQDTRRPHPNR